MGEVAGSDREMDGAQRQLEAARLRTPAEARSAFDDALEASELARAAAAYASRHGEPGSAGYRAAWLRFRQNVRSFDELQRLRTPSPRRKPADGRGPR